jgi:hypothetical protein
MKKERKKNRREGVKNDLSRLLSFYIDRNHGKMGTTMETGTIAYSRDPDDW